MIACSVVCYAPSVLIEVERTLTSTLRSTPTDIISSLPCWHAALYMPAFAFSTSVFPLLSKIDIAFVTLLRPNSGSSTKQSTLSMTDKVRIKSLVSSTRVTAANCASSAGYSAGVQDLSSEEDSDTEDEEVAYDGRLGSSQLLSPWHFPKSIKGLSKYSEIR